MFGTADNAETLCQVNMTDVESVALTGFKLTQMLYGKDSIRFSKAYTPWEFKKIWKALSPVEQYARISYSEEKDRESFVGFVRYLEARNLVGIYPFLTLLREAF